MYEKCVIKKMSYLSVKSVVYTTRDCYIMGDKPESCDRSMRVRAQKFT